MTSPDTDPGTEPGTEPEPGPPAAPLALLSTLGGRLNGPFVEQFRAMHRGPTGVQLLLELHPALHHDHLADTVAQILAVLGVAEARHMNRVDAAPVLLDDRARVVLAGYAVRVIRGGDDRPTVCLYQPQARTALITTRLADVGGGIDQRTLHLTDLVDQAARHAAEYVAEQAGTEALELASFLPEPEPALRCDTCGRVTGAGIDAEAIEVTAGAECNYDDPHTGEECPGHLEAVTIVVAPARPAWPKDRAPATVYAVVFGNYDPAEIDSLWTTEAAAQRHADAKESGAWHVQEWAVQA